MWLTTELLWTTCTHHSDTKKPDSMETAKLTLKAMMEQRDLAKKTMDGLLPALSHAALPSGRGRSQLG